MSPVNTDKAPKPYPVLPVVHAQKYSESSVFGPWFTCGSVLEELK
jgi:hypothetical protein